MLSHYLTAIITYPGIAIYTEAILSFNTSNIFVLLIKRNRRGIAHACCVLLRFSILIVTSYLVRLFNLVYVVAKRNRSA